MRRAGLWATMLAAAVPAVMTLLLAVLNRAALALHYEGGAVMRVSVGATLLADGMLLLIIRQLLYDVLTGRRAGTLPRLVPGLLFLYGILFWFLWAPTVVYFAPRLGLPALARGWQEPESQLVRTGLVIAFVLVSYQVLVGRYRRGGPLARLAGAWARWRGGGGDD